MVEERSKIVDSTKKRLRVSSQSSIYFNLLNCQENLRIIFRNIKSISRLISTNDRAIEPNGWGSGSGNFSKLKTLEERRGSMKVEGEAWSGAAKYVATNEGERL